MTSNKLPQRSVALIVVCLTIFGTGLSFLHFILAPYNKGFEEYSITTALHVIPGIIYLGLAPFQFLSAIRRRQIWLHRILGRLLSLVGLIIGATAFIMAILFPFSGLVESIAVSIFATIFLTAIIKGFLALRNNNIVCHREWMIRAFALGLAIATAKLFFLPIFFAITNPTLEDIKTLFITSFILAFTTHMIFAELWIRKTR